MLTFHFSGIIWPFLLVIILEIYTTKHEVGIHHLQTKLENHCLVTFKDNKLIFPWKKHKQK
jgi:hypothetical protein